MNFLEVFSNRILIAWIIAWTIGLNLLRLGQLPSQASISTNPEYRLACKQ